MAMPNFTPLRSLVLSSAILSKEPPPLQRSPGIPPSRALIGEKPRCDNPATPPPASTDVRAAVTQSSGKISAVFDQRRDYLTHYAAEVTQVQPDLGKKGRSYCRLDTTPARVKGRKIRALVDRQGLPLRAVIHSGGVQDRDGVALALDKIRNSFPWLELYGRTADTTPIDRPQDCRPPQ